MRGLWIVQLPSPSMAVRLGVNTEPHHPILESFIISQSRSKDFPGFSVGWSCGARSASWQSATIRWFLTIETYCSASIVEEYLILPLDPPQLTACTSILERNQTEIIRICIMDIWITEP